MVSFIDAHRAEYGVESICAQLPIAPSLYYEHKARQADPKLWSADIAHHPGLYWPTRKHLRARRGPRKRIFMVQAG
jgi:hypothetical protein